MNHHDNTVQQRAQDLTRLARALYEAALHEEDKERLEMHRNVALGLKELVDEAIDDDALFHADLGLELLLFIELKADGSDGAETGRVEALAVLEYSEKRFSYHKTQAKS